MSDQEGPGRGSLPGPGSNRSDAVERLRAKLEAMRAGETATPDAEDSKLTRLPRRPRRTTETAPGPPPMPWNPPGGSVYDPAPTRPVTRAELQGETGWLPVDPGRAPHPAPGDAASRGDGSVIDFDAARRRRAGDNAPATGIRPSAKPRRIRPGTDESTAEHPAPSASDPDDPAPRR
ncbi:hypothetical protein [Nocardia tengchongensis]|uniref:hypothetical protein n=1 Tax=Nocardia tengchongensis TaxID=2055889 RepID=UPI0036D1C0AB